MAVSANPTLNAANFFFKGKINDLIGVARNSWKIDIEINGEDKVEWNSEDGGWNSPTYTDLDSDDEDLDDWDWQQEPGEDAVVHYVDVSELYDKFMAKVQNGMQSLD